MSSPLSDDRKELIRKLWTDGLSASQIADDIGEGATRSAVLGVVHRLGIQRGTKIVERPRPIERKLVAVPAAAPKPERVKLKSDGTRAPYFAATPLPEEPPILDASTNCTLLDLRAHMCRWPLGDPATPEFRFCGAHVECGSYCPGHTRMAYQPRDARKDRAFARIVVSNLPKAQAIRRGAVA